MGNCMNKGTCVAGRILIEETCSWPAFRDILQYPCVVTICFLSKGTQYLEFFNENFMYKV
jgi:hypothetical protein